MKKLLKRFLQTFITIEVIPFNDLGLETEIHSMQIFGKTVTSLQVVKPNDEKDELCEYLGIL